MEIIGKNINRQDKNGNYLLNNEAFNLGVSAIKEYLKSFEAMANYHNQTAHEYLKGSNIYIDALIEVSGNAIEAAGLNPNYDITYTDYNEMIEAATGEKINLEKRRYACGFECWEKATNSINWAIVASI